MKKWMLLVLALAMLASGAISGISFQSTLSGMRQVVQGQPGTFVMMKNDLFMLAWPAGENAWAFACLNKFGDPIKNIASYVNGTRVDTLTMANFLADLETDGWQSVSAKTLPAGISGALGSYMTYLMSIVVRSLPSPLLVPVIIMPDMQVPTGVSQ
jgi:hypothetical protein